MSTETNLVLKFSGKIIENLKLHNGFVWYVIKIMNKEIILHIENQFPNKMNEYTVG